MYLVLAKFVSDLQYKCLVTFLNHLSSDSHYMKKMGTVKFLSKISNQFSD
jgi:hypothetical protein